MLLLRSLRVSLALLAGAAAVTFPVLDDMRAWADDEDEDEDDGGDDEGGDEEAEEDEDEEEADEDQPPVTAGGLYTLKTYPQGEIQRPLTLTKGITELRAGVGFDISNKTAFETFGLSLDGRYGYQDNVEFQAGFKGIKNFKDISFYAAFEGSIVYDVVDFRTGLGIQSAEDETGERSLNIGIPIGFPFRYAPKPQVAVVALETAFEIQFDSKPDVTPNIGIVVQPVPIVALLIKAQLRVPDFDFSNTDNVAIPATFAIQLSPNNKLDAGMEFTFNNLKPKDPDGDGMLEAPPFYDDRFLLFFGQIRI